MWLDCKLVHLEQAAFHEHTYIHTHLYAYIYIYTFICIDNDVQITLFASPAVLISEAVVDDTWEWDPEKPDEPLDTASQVAGDVVFGGDYRGYMDIWIYPLVN